jgi:hypothetical protein
VLASGLVAREDEMMRTTAAVLAGVLAVACGNGKTDGAAQRVEEPAPPAEEPAPAADEPEAAAAKPESAAGKGDGGGEIADVMLIVPLGGTKKSISFPHKMHADPSTNSAVGGRCEVCHHEVGGGSEARQCTTAECHDNKTANVPSAMDAYHQTCRDGCHKKIRAAQPGGHPKLAKLKTCSGCHAH